MAAHTYWRLYIGAMPNVYAQIGTVSFLNAAQVNQSTGGTATASSEYNSSWAAGNAFDGNPTSEWASAGVSSSEWIAYQHPSPVDIVFVGVKVSASYPVSGLALQYSDDGVSWSAASPLYVLAGQPALTTGSYTVLGLSASRRPLVVVDGQIKELPEGDTLPPQAPAAHTHPATSITNTPTGGLAATNVQAAIDELDTEKLPKSGGTMTGPLTLPANGLVVGTSQIVASGGNVGLGAAVPRAPLHSFNASNFGNPDTTGTGVTGVSARIQGGSVNMDIGVYSSGNLWIQGRLNTNNATTFQLVLNPVGGPVLVGSGGLGYAAGIGAGGSVTQTTNKSTSVTLNKPSGQITMNSENLAAGAAVRFYVYNDKVTSASTVGCAVDGSTPSALEYEAKAVVVGSGYFVVRLSNVAGSSKATSVLINFTVALGSAS